MCLCTYACLYEWQTECGGNYTYIFLFHWKTRTLETFLMPPIGVQHFLDTIGGCRKSTHLDLLLTSMNTSVATLTTPILRTYQRSSFLRMICFAFCCGVIKKTRQGQRQTGHATSYRGDTTLWQNGTAMSQRCLSDTFQHLGSPHKQHEEAIGAPWFGTSAPSVAGQSGITPQVDMEHLFG